MRLFSFAVTSLVLCPSLLQPAVALGSDGTRPFTDVVALADTVFVGEVVDRRSSWQASRRTRRIVTQVTFRVESALKGRARTWLPLDFLGGSVEATQHSAYGVPLFSVGDRAVLMIAPIAPGAPLTGEHFRWFPINKAPDGTDHVTLPNRWAFSSLIDVDSPVSESLVPRRPMSLQEFKKGLRQLITSASTRPRGHRSASESFGFLDSVFQPDLLIPFPPRDQTLNFFLALEGTYRDTLGRQQNNQGFVDAEGSAVWFPEWLRYVLNECSAAEAETRVLQQIRGQGIQPVCGSAPEGVINFPPRNQSLDFLNTLDAFYRDDLNRTVQLSFVDLEGKAVWLQEYLRYRVNTCSHNEAQTRVVNQIRTGVLAPICGPASSFTTGTYLVGTDIVSGRFYSNPRSGCYWKRLSGLSGNISDIIANDFIGHDSGQEIVDILPSDVAFSTDADCKSWTLNSPVAVASTTTITQGRWLVGSQVAPGTYSANTTGGCFWERLRNFSGLTSSGTIDNDFAPDAGPQFVTIAGSDLGFSTDDDCGTWTRVSASSEPLGARGDLEHNYQLNRRQEGSPVR